MKILSKIILVILVFLAVLSGVTKIMLMPQDVAFFGAYGFFGPILMALVTMVFVALLSFVAFRAKMGLD